jgi:type I restriction enzyme M protein
LEQAASDQEEDQVTPGTKAPPPGFLADYITRQVVRDTPEEREAVQVLAQRLVEDYGYPKTHVQTHPQFRVRRSPADKAKSYPVDIAVFNCAEKTEADLFLIAECKRKNEQDGLAQLDIPRP